MGDSGASSDATKAKKYDRQLRIWGPHGQQALEQARLCLLNCGPTGSETLKNLVLGGIAAFTVVDGSRVQQSDLGNNFLLDKATLGLSKAMSVTGFLKELNDTVTGSYVEEEPENLIHHNPGFFSGFTLVIATQVREPALLQLEQTCRELGVSLIMARSYGLVGSMRVRRLFRFHKPWPELEQLARSIDLQEVDEATHAHVPYGVLLVKAAAKWAAHNGKMPSSAKERADFKQLIKSWQRHTSDGFPIEEENLKEAVSNAHKVWAPAVIPAEVAAVLDDPATNIGRDSPDFWVMAAALKRFVEQEGALPQEGSIPDMTATTEMYLRLQQVYRARAEAELEAVRGYLTQLLQSIGRSPEAIPAPKLRHFVKHSRDLRVVRPRTLAQETGPETCRADALRQALSAEGTSVNAGLYVLLRAVDKFHAVHNRYPGSFYGEADGDVPLLKTAAMGILSEAGVSSVQIADDLVGEMARFGAGELHCVAAIVAGIAAQEAIKLITRQFVPASGTLLYNGMASTTSLFRF